MVASLLEIRGIASEIVTVRTKGDRKPRKKENRITSLTIRPGLFTHEIESALVRRKADIAVHSMKDVPLELREGLAIAAVLEREDPRDVLVFPEAA